mgnify:FL=1
MASLELDTPVQYVKGVGPARAEQLAELGIVTVADLLNHFPRRFDLRRSAQPIASVNGTEDTATVAGTVVTTEYQGFGRRPYFQASLDDGTGVINVRWFHGGYLRNQIIEGATLAVSGKPTLFRNYPQFANPQWQLLDSDQAGQTDRDQLMPVYPAGGKLTSGMIAKAVRGALPHVEELIPRWYDRAYCRQRHLPTRGQAVAAMHKPEDTDQWEAARRRIAYDECLLMQLAMALLRARTRYRPAYPLRGSAEIDRRIRRRFPFPLTAAQDRAVGEIARDLAAERPMNRLLQGDVGSGKTVVALYAALLAVANGKQVAVMAPTEILAEQHYQKVAQYLDGSRVRLARLTGSQKPAERQAVQDALAAGEIDIAVGTHALLSEGVRFQRLGLVVVDEQHKFGVRQRSAIQGKGYAPHCLVMTATPIPRTLALTVFGDLDVTVIDELPPGRGEVTTELLADAQLPALLRRLAGQLTDGRQAYFVYPLVSPAPELELTAATEAIEQLHQGPLNGVPLGLLHGQMPARQKQQVMEAFREGRIRGLVASVVIEVGVDVPAASIMVIAHAERFGLAQLHQLRGRIGRGSEASQCYLVSSAENPLARRRLEVLTRTTDGFEVAEEDLRIRGPGEFFGTRQHGLPELKVADLIEDHDLLRMARRDAFQIIREDPTLDAPHHRQIRAELLKTYHGRFQLLRA